MDYNKLYLFQIVMNEKSITKAAKKVHRSQSAVSQQIASLEQELGFRLFKRRKSRLFLSPEGEALSKILGNRLNEMSDAIHSLQDNRHKVAGKIRLGALMDGSTQFELALEINEFTNLYPEVEFEVVFGTNEENEQRLLAGDIDLAISILFQEKSSITQHIVRKSKHTFACHKNLKTKMRGSSMGEILSYFNIVDFNRSFMCLKPWVKKNFPEHVSVLNKRTPSLIVPSHIESLKFVRLGWGVAILPDYIIEMNQDSATDASVN